MMHNRSSAINKMNELGAAGVPFLFFTDFLGSQAYISPISELPAGVSFQINHEKFPAGNHPKSFHFQKSPVAFKTFQKSFKQVVDQINLGNSYLVNLSFETPIQTNLSIEEIHEYCKARYKLRYKDQFVVFSPETFIKIQNNKILSYPMKGTIDASKPNAEQIILNDPKETAEHVTIVDLIRNDLSKIASNVTVPRFRFITKIKTHEKSLLQVSSEIRGDLPANWQSEMGTILFELLPAGSISGAPKKQTIRIIQNAETYDRGFYTGVCGYFDGQNLDSGVMIRFIEQKNGQMVYKSGGGITSFSQAENEYQEIIDKVYIPI